MLRHHARMTSRIIKKFSPEDWDVGGQSDDDGASQDGDGSIGDLLLQAKPTAKLSSNGGGACKHAQPAVDGLWCWAIKSLDLCKQNHHYVSECIICCAGCGLRKVRGSRSVSLESPAAKISTDCAHE